MGAASGCWCWRTAKGVEWTASAVGWGVLRVQALRLNWLFHACAQTLLLQWAEEIERHVAPGRLSWARYLPPGVAAAAAAGQHAEEEEGDVATRTRRSRRVAAAGGTVRLGCGRGGAGAGRLHSNQSSSGRLAALS